MQQNSFPFPHSLAELVWLAIVAFLTWAGTQFIPRIKKKQTEAETAKTHAETRSIDLHDTLLAGDMLRQLMVSSAQAMLDVERLRKERDAQQARADRLEIELRMYELQMDAVKKKN